MPPSRSFIPVAKAVFGGIFAALNLALLIVSAVAWARHKNTCFAAWSDLLYRDVSPEDAPFIPCGLIRWLPYCLLVVVSSAGFFVPIDLFWVRRRNKERRPFAPVHLILLLFLLVLVIGWTPPGNFSTWDIAIQPPPRSLLPDITLPPFSQADDEPLLRTRETDRHNLSRREDLEPLEMFRRIQQDKEEEREAARVLEEIRDRFKQRWMENLKENWREYDTHHYMGGVHGITGGFLFDSTDEHMEAMGIAIILAHGAFVAAVFLAMVECMPHRYNRNRSRDDWTDREDTISSDI